MRTMLAAAGVAGASYWAARSRVGWIRHQPGNRNDCIAYADSGIDQVTRGAYVIADGGYAGPNYPDVIIPHRKPPDGSPLPR